MQGTHTIVQVTLLVADHKEQSLVTTYRQQHYFSYDWVYYIYMYTVQYVSRHPRAQKHIHITLVDSQNT